MYIATTQCTLHLTSFVGQFVELFSGKVKQFKFNHKCQPGSHTHFRVRARNAIGWSECSEETVHSVGQAAPATPSPPSLSSRTSHSLTLHWSPPPGAVSISSFCLEMDDPNLVSLLVHIYYSIQLACFRFVRAMDSVQSIREMAYPMCAAVYRG